MAEKCIIGTGPPSSRLGEFDNAIKRRNPDLQLRFSRGVELAGHSAKSGILSPLSRRVWLAILALGALLSFQAQSAAGAEVPREFQIKANWLLQFSYYVEWPPATLTSKEAPLVIGILGPDPFRQALEKLLEKKVGGREIKLVRFDSVEQLGDCHILYVNLPESREVQRALDVLRGKPILTISDRDEFSQQGGMINLLKYKNHLKPHINNAAARRAGLVIDPRLLTVSEITEK
jgi:hypothetical protein